MLPGEIIYHPSTSPSKSVYVEWREWCAEQDPKPVYCEVPEAKLRTVGTSGTPQYTYSFATLPSPSPSPEI